MFIVEHNNLIEVSNNKQTNLKDSVHFQSLIFETTFFKY